MRSFPRRVLLLPTLLVVGTCGLSPVWQVVDTERLAMSGYASHSYQWPYLELDPAWIAAHTGSTVAHLEAIADPYADDVEGQDPWGNQFVKVGNEIAYSCGPNGLDEGGRGDDVAVYPYWVGVAYRDAPAFLFVLGLLVGVVTGLILLLDLRPASGAGAMGCFLPAGLAVGGLILSLHAWLRSNFGPQLPAPLLVPWWAGKLLAGAFAGTLYFMWVAGVWAAAREAPEVEPAAVPAPLADPG